MIVGGDLMYIIDLWLSLNMYYGFVYVVIGVLYFVFCYLLVRLVRKLELKEKK